MKNYLSLTQARQFFARILNRFHVLIFTLTVIIGVSIAIFMLYGLMSDPSEQLDISQTENISFDQETIERIENFNTSSSTEDTFNLPPGRINPLVAE